MQTKEKELLEKLGDFVDNQNKRLEEKAKADSWQNFATKFNVIAGAFYMLTTIFFFTHMIEISSWKAKVEKTLSMDSTVAALMRRVDSEKLRSEIRDQLGGHLSIASYFAIESERSEVVAQVFIDFGRILGIKEEELEYFKRESVKKLNRGIKLGVTREDKK